MVIPTFESATVHRKGIILDCSSRLLVALLSHTFSGGLSFMLGLHRRDTAIATLVSRLLDQVPVIFLSIKMSEAEPESNTSEESKHSDDAVVPHEQWVLGQSNKGLANGAGDGTHEQVYCHDQTLHVLG